METIVQSNQEHQAMTEDSSDRSDESSTMSQEYQSRGFEEYDIVKRLRASNVDGGIGRNESQTTVRSKDFRLSVESSFEPSELARNGGSQCDDLQAREMSLTLVKTKEYGFASGHIGDVLNCHADRMNEVESTKELSQMCRTKDSTMKEALLNLAARQEYLAVSFERSPKECNYLDREIKEYGIAKGYNLTIDRMKDYNSPLERPRESHVNGLPVRERTSGIGILDNPRIHDVNEHRNIHVQSRGRQNLESIVYDRMRRPHHHYLNRMDFTGQNLTNLQHARQTSVTQMQQSQQQQQQQQQQIKSFTIDAILAHRNNQRERHQRNQQQQQRKMARVPRQECQEVTTTKSSSGTGNSGDTSVIETVSGASVGKAKRVRTIFTAEQLERLEGEFARQQYLVGRERLYLAHELHLTEAQVKVWFQNRRIKWRKVNHEQQCQAVSEHRQRFSLQPEKLEIHEDESNDTTNNNWCVNSAITATSSGDDSSLIVSCNQQNRDNRGSSIVKP